jgi:hypothetical protein
MTEKIREELQSLNLKFMNEPSQVAIEEVLTQLRLVMIQSLIGGVINEQIMRGEIRRMKKANRMRRVRGHASNRAHAASPKHAGRLGEARIRGM